MEGSDHYSPSNPFATEEYQADVSTPWGMDPAPAAGVADTADAPTPGAADTADAPSNGFGAVAPAESAPAQDHDETPAAPALGNPGDEVRQAVSDLTGVLQRLTARLDESDAERAQILDQSADLQRQVRALEVHRDQANKMVDTILRGAGGSLSHNDLETIQNMMDALKQDPDRLTVLFTVVQHAGQLASVIADYAQLRRLAESA